ncbi:MAG: thiamine pyrophosphate-dependent enzyme [Candidatus Woesearchaeota archaeon]
MIRKMLNKTRGGSSEDFSSKMEDAPVHDDVPAPQKPQHSEPSFQPNDLDTPVKPNWCPGCGNFGIWFALKNALSQLGLPRERYVIIGGIGCHGHMTNFVDTYNFEGLHGRPIPVSEGVKLANDRLKVIVVAGDGDTYGEGMNHFLAGLRANHDVTLIVHNNMVYGLTTGQTSPTSQKGYRSKSTPDGVIEVPVNPLSLGISAGGGFISRGFAGDVKHLTSLIVEAVRHDGFSLVDVLQNCVSFNKVNTIQWFNQRVVKLEEEGHDPSDKMRALAKALEFGDRIPIGLFYRDSRESYQDDLPEVEQEPLVRHPTEGIDMSGTFEKFV